MLKLNYNVCLILTKQVKHLQMPLVVGSLG